MRRALIALVALGFLGTGVAAAILVPVLSVADGEQQYRFLLSDGGRLSYSYRQSIYGVTVVEDFVRHGDRLELRRVSATDIRAIEYFRWDTPIHGVDGSYATEPPATSVSDLVIRITPGGEQRLASDAWTIVLRDRFGDTIVHVTLERAALLTSLVRGLVW